jgi:MFS family permease
MHTWGHALGSLGGEQPLRDRKILYAGAFIRSLATSLIGVLLGIYLAQLHFNPAQVGLVVGAGLTGAAVAAFLVTIAGDRLGRRRALIGLAILGAVGAVVAVFSSHLLVLAGAAFVGMLNGMGRDRGASSVLDQAILPATTGHENRTLGFAWYNVFQDAGHALGALLAGAPAVLRYYLKVEELASFRVVVVGYAILLLLTAIVYSRLSAAVETSTRARAPPLSEASRRGLWKISALFGLDSLGGGFLTASLLAFFFFQRFGATEGVVGVLFFGARIANAASHLGAAWLAKHLGLVRTMVFTHIPSSLLLVTVAFAPNFPVAAVLFLLREGLVEMDVPTRQSYVMAMVRPDERTFASGITNLVRLAGWALAPSFAGLLMQGTSLVAPLFIGAGMKISYDLLLYRAFWHLRPPEEA